MSEQDMKPVSFTVRNIPRSVYEAIKAKAESERRSVNSQMIVCLEGCAASPYRHGDTPAARAPEGTGEG